MTYERLLCGIVLCVVAIMLSGLFKMNIFELVLSDPSSYQQTSQELVAQQNNWQLFQNTLSALLSVSPAEAEPLLERNRNQWANARKYTPELIPVMADYYLRKEDATQINWRICCWESCSPDFNYSSPLWQIQTNSNSRLPV
jgi:hypothetical protein